MYKMKKKLLLCILFFKAASAIFGQDPAEAECTGGWVKFEDNPVLGGKLDTIFDISVLRGNDGIFRMYCSWRPKRSIALSESKDGLKWSDPVICLSFIDTSRWERDLNRPVVIEKDGMYHMWYTGQAKGHSWIGYAVSSDGIEWSRKSN
jgi:hypothetical protein